MEKKSMGEIITALRKQQNMTQRELAEKMRVTDKAVSKWERNLSCPDITSLPRLAEVLGVSVETLLNSAPAAKAGKEDITALILKTVPLAMGIAVAVLSILDELPVTSGLAMLGIGLGCVGIFLLKYRS